MHHENILEIVRAYFAQENKAASEVTLDFHVFPGILDWYYVYENKNSVLRCAYQTWAQIRAEVPGVRSFEDSLDTISNAYDMRFPYWDLLTGADEVVCAHTVKEYGNFISYVVSVLRPSSSAEMTGDVAASLHGFLPSGYHLPADWKPALIRTRNVADGVVGELITHNTHNNPVNNLKFTLDIVRKTLKVLNYPVDVECSNKLDTVVVENTERLSEQLKPCEAKISELGENVYMNGFTEIENFVRKYMSDTFPLSIEFYRVLDGHPGMPARNDTILVVFVTNDMRVTTKPLGVFHDPHVTTIGSNHSKGETNEKASSFVDYLVRRKENRAYAPQSPHLVVDSEHMHSAETKESFMTGLGDILTKIHPDNDYHEDVIDLLYRDPALDPTSSQHENAAFQFMQKAVQHTDTSHLSNVVDEMLQNLLPESVRFSEEKESILRLATRMAKAGETVNLWNPWVVVAGFTYDIARQKDRFAPMFKFAAGTDVIDGTPLVSAVKMAMTPEGQRLLQRLGRPDFMAVDIAETAGLGMSNEHLDLFYHAFMGERILQLRDKFSHEAVLVNLRQYAELVKISEKAHTPDQVEEFWFSVIIRYTIICFTWFILHNVAEKSPLIMKEAIANISFFLYLYSKIPMLIFAPRVLGSLIQAGMRRWETHVKAPHIMLRLNTLLADDMLAGLYDALILQNGPMRRAEILESIARRANQLGILALNAQLVRITGAGHDSIIVQLLMNEAPAVPAGQQLPVLAAPMPVPALALGPPTPQLPQANFLRTRQRALLDVLYDH